MELARYVIVFASVAIGGAVLGLLFFIVTSPAVGFARGTNLGRSISALLNGVAVTTSVVLANWFCRLTGSDASYFMYLFPLVGMVLNDRHRIARMSSGRTVGGQIIEEEPSLRAGLVETERMNAAADLFGFAIGLILLPDLRLI